ncbi:unnamed protein product [Closterium sp. NIES-65]|nr:unnamed protein product [Closterium sp. NIES-65]
MSCGADGEGKGSIDRSRGGKSSGGSESSGGRDSSGEGGTGGSELLSQEGKRSWVQWCLPPPRDDYRDKEFIQIERGPLALRQAFIQILSADPTALRTGGLDVRFTGEGGAAGPGVLREFFAFVRAHLFDPNLGLFSHVPHDPSRFSLSLASRANPAEAKEYLRFAGRILALALAHQVPLGVKLSRSLFVLLAARPPSLADAADDDPQFVASCRSLLAMAEREREEAAEGGGGREGGVESLCLTFVASVEDPMGGAAIEAELVPGGSERVVRADDVAEFVQRMVQFRVCGVVEEEGEALRRGMEDILGSGGGRDVVPGKGDVAEGREGMDGKGGMDGNVRGRGGREGGYGGGNMEGGDGQQTPIQKNDDDCCIDSVEGMSLAAMLAPLSCDDLNLLLHGEDRHVAVSDWQAHTVYHGYCLEDPQQQQRPATTVVRGGPGGDAIVSAVGFQLVRSAAPDDFASDGASPVATTTASTAADNVTIKYHGGPVVVGNPTVNIYHIYYGSWGAGSGKEILEAFVQSLSSDSGSQGGAGDASVKGWWAITAAYYQSGPDGKKNVSSKVRLAGTVIDNYSHGKNPSDSDLRAILKSQVGPGKPLPLDPHGIYCPGACGERSPSPNGNPGIDGMITSLAHEITETATNPAGSGWFVDGDGENGDECAWNFGSTKTGSLQNGQKFEYNLVGLDGRKFLVQQNWDRVLNKCVLQNALPSPSPPSPPPPPPSSGGSEKMQCDFNCASASNPMSCQCTCTKTG